MKRPVIPLVLFVLFTSLAIGSNADRDEYRASLLVPSDDVFSSHLMVDTNRSRGTGIVIDDHFVLTCHHVVENCQTIKVVYEKWSSEAEVVYSDPKLDLALLKSKRKLNKFVPAKVAEKAPKRGAPLWCVGASYGEEPDQLSFGWFVNDNLHGHPWVEKTWLISLTSAPGNSGGPVYNAYTSELVGVLTGAAIVKTSFIVPATEVNKFLKTARSKTAKAK